MRLDNGIIDRLDKLLSDTIPQGTTRFAWLRQYEPGNNSRVINQLLDKLNWTTAIDVPTAVLEGVPRHRIIGLKRHGERYYADGMRDLSDHRRLAILAVCMIEWHADITDAIVETHDRIVVKLYRASERIRDDQITAQRTLIQQTLANVGASIVAAREAGESIDVAIEQTCGWEAFDGLVETPCTSTPKLVLIHSTL